MRERKRERKRELVRERYGEKDSVEIMINSYV